MSTKSSDIQLVQPNAWQEMRRHTPARIALGRVGASMPTDEVLRFGWAHAQAQDAVHRPLAPDGWCAELAAAGMSTVRVASRAPDRQTYLLRPDLGRRLDEPSAALLSDWRPAPTVDADDDADHPADDAVVDTKAALGRPYDLVIVIGDGLSSLAVDRHAAGLVRTLMPLLPTTWRLAPIVVASQARVALGDEVGEILQARIAVVLIGERPGLSSPDSLGIYLTFDPRVGRHDAQRNCISNVRPEGLPIEVAARKLAWLLRASEKLGASGVALKDGSDRIEPTMLGP